MKDTPSSDGAQLWVLSLEVNALDVNSISDILERAEEPAALSVSMRRLGPSHAFAPDEDETGHELGGVWRIEALYEDAPSTNLLDKLLPSNLQRRSVEPLPDRDWVTVSQRGFAPVEAGRFRVADPDHWTEIAGYPYALRVTPGPGFGTGHHGSTAGCLMALDHLARRFQANGWRPERLLDLGCGSGILTVAAARLWHRPILASDIDAASLEVARETVSFNGARPHVRLVQAAGFNHPDLRRGGPYDLICANIFARPLIGLAPEMVQFVVPGGFLILSGLICEQEAKVAQAYRCHGFSRLKRLEVEGWVTLIFAN